MRRKLLHVGHWKMLVNLKPTVLIGLLLNSKVPKIYLREKGEIIYL